MPSRYPKPRFLTIMASCAALLALPVSAAVTVTESWVVNLGIPDGDPVGIADTRVIATDIISIDSVVVSITLSDSFAMWNGDFYAYLAHSGGFSVLLNRTGRTALDPVGYGDAGFAVTFDDTAVFDIHLYRETSDPGGGVLTGTWQPDGRDADPDLVLDTSPRGAGLSSFNGLDPNGSWTLFVADLAAGGEATFDAWSLTITGPIPEPTGILLAVISFGALALRRHRS